MQRTAPTLGDDDSSCFASAAVGGLLPSWSCATPAARPDAVRSDGLPPLLGTDSRAASGAVMLDGGAAPAGRARPPVLIGDPLSSPPPQPCLSSPPAGDVSSAVRTPSSSARRALTSFSSLCTVASVCCNSMYLCSKGAIFTAASDLAIAPSTLLTPAVGFGVSAAMLFSAASGSGVSEVIDSSAQTICSAAAGMIQTVTVDCEPGGNKEMGGPVGHHQQQQNGQVRRGPLKLNNG